MAGWLHFQYAADCQAANPIYGYLENYGCNNNWGNIGTSTPADFSQIGSASWSRHCYQRVFASPPAPAPPPPSPPLPPLLPLSPPLPPLPPVSEYATSSAELVAALVDGSTDYIILKAGVYVFTDSMCGDSALCINRDVTIEAEEAGTVKLYAMDERRVISIGSASVVKLIGLNITGGFATKGGGLYVEPSCKANLEGCNVHNNMATKGGGLFVEVQGAANMQSCKFYENEATSDGGGIYISGTASLTNCDIYENQAAGGGGGVFVSYGELVLKTSLLKSNTGLNGAQLFLDVGSDLTYVLPVPLGHYLEGAFECKKSMCKEVEDCTDSAPNQCTLKKCDTQNCQYRAFVGKFVATYKPGDDIPTDIFPKSCVAGFQGSSNATQKQSSQICAGACDAGFYCELGTSQPVPCPAGRYSLSGARSAGECASCSSGSVANATGMKACTHCAAGTFQDNEGELTCKPCTAGSYCKEGAAAARPCLAGSYSNSTNLTSAEECTPVKFGSWAPTGSAFPEECPKSGFTCPGAALDKVSDPPGSKPILIDAGQTSVNIKEDIITFSLEFNADPDEFDLDDLDAVIAKLAAHYQVYASLISAEATRLSNGRRLTSDGTTINAGNRLLLTITIRVHEKSEDEATTPEMFASDLAKFAIPELFGADSLLTQEMSISTRVVGQESVDCPKGYCEALPLNYQH